MDKVAVLIGASSESIFSLNEAKKLGLRVVAFDGNRNASGFKFADEYYIVDIKDPKNIINILKDKRYLPVLILPVPIGRYLITAGYLNDYYGLKGTSYKEADVSTDKHLFHEILFKAGLRNANSILLKSGSCVSANDIKYPVIFKPRFGSGSRDCLAIFNTQEFEKMIKPNMPFSEDFVIESLINGVEYGVDGVALDGVFYPLNLRQKMLTPYPYRQAIGCISVEFRSDVVEFMNKIINQLHIKNSLINADIIISDNDIFIIEISPRPSGHYLSTHLMEHTIGISNIREFIKFAIGKEYSFKPKFYDEMMIRFFDFENCKIIPPNLDELKKEFDIVDYKCDIGNGVLSTVKEGSDIMGRGFVILRRNNKNVGGGGNISELISLSNMLLNKFKRM